MSSNASSGTFPSGWVKKTLGDVCSKPQYGWTTSASAEGRVKLLRTTDLTHGLIDWASVPYCKEVPKDVEKYLVAPGDVFISRAGSVGVSVLIEAVEALSVFASYLIRIRPNETVTSSFVKQFLESPSYWEQIAGASSGVALANINGTKIKNIQIPVPPIEEQIKIVEILEEQLSRLDAALASVRLVRKEAARFRRSLLHAAFTGALTVQDLSEGQIPHGWRKSTISDVADVAGGRTPTKFEQRLMNSGSPNRNVPFYKVGDMNSSNRYLSESRVYFSESEASNFGIEILKAGTVIFPKAGGAIATNKKRILELPGAIDLNCMGVTANGELHEKLLYWFFESFNLSSIADGTVLPQISKKKVSALEIAFPIISEEQIKLLDEIEAEVSKSEAVVLVVDGVEKKASALRRSLLHAAFSGKLTKEWREGAHV